MHGVSDSLRDTDFAGAVIVVLVLQQIYLAGIVSSPTLESAVNSGEIPYAYGVVS